ncbi:MAG: hypothetical protein QXP49_06480, partial [Nitrososphaerota archaeon]
MRTVKTPVLPCSGSKLSTYTLPSKYLGAMPRRPATTFRRSYRMRIGYEGEYYLMKKFTSLQRPGYYAVRTPGSGTGKTFKPDLLVVEAGELYAIEVKSTNRDSIYVRPEQLERLRRFAELFRVKCPHCEKEFGPRPVL